mmetsp:Transcript_3108/g.7329  ORF Transcript_3108/g.7329 Transcript_3108/m.7329 type:complete len:239 (-) Transcript_3108:555-1271(-)
MRRSITRFKIIRPVTSCTLVREKCWSASMKVFSATCSIALSELAIALRTWKRTQWSPPSSNHSGGRVSMSLARGPRARRALRRWTIFLFASSLPICRKKVSRKSLSESINSSAVPGCETMPAISAPISSDTSSVPAENPPSSHPSCDPNTQCRAQAELLSSAATKITPEDITSLASSGMGVHAWMRRESEPEERSEPTTIAQSSGSEPRPGAIDPTPESSARPLRELLRSLFVEASGS